MITFMLRCGMKQKARIYNLYIGNLHDKLTVIINSSTYEVKFREI